MLRGRVVESAFRKAARWGSCSTSARPCSSFVAGIFKFKVVPQEVFPYPEKRFDADEQENIETLMKQERSGDSEFNMFGARIPDEYGGIGLSHTAHALLFEELGSSSKFDVFNTIQHSGVCTHLIMTVGTKEVQGKYLTGMSDGSILMGWAVEEKSCGTDISAMTATAESKGNGYVVSGVKRVFNAKAATHFLVLAKATTQQTNADGTTSVVRRCTFFVCPKNAPGVSVNGDDVTFTEAPADDIVGVFGEGFKDRMISHFTEQYLYSAALLGTLKSVVEELKIAVPAKWTRSTVAACACSIYAMESALYALTANLDVPTADSLLEAALVNAFIKSESVNWLYQLGTAIPTNKELETAMWSAHNMIELVESQDFLYSTAVCCGVEDYGLFFQSSSTLQIMQLRSMRSLGVKEKLPITNSFPECAGIEDAIVKFSTAVETTFVRNGSQVPYQQLLINRLGEAGGLIYAATASASRAHQCGLKGLPTAKTEKLLAKAFIKFAMERANRLTDECQNVGLTADDMYKRIALELCEDALAGEKA